MSGIFDLPVHPAAAVFPMLDDDELRELADDIAANGLRVPLVVYANGAGTTMLVDGRNRREACRIAGVEPTTQPLEGDTVSFILSANINRRHLTKGQRAMAVAKICPVSGQSTRSAAGTANVSKTRVSIAQVVLQFAPDLADSVLSGAVPLDTAYATATERKRAAEGPAMRLQSLQRNDPDLADQVVEDRIKLEDAEAAGRDRRSRERAQRQAFVGNIRLQTSRLPSSTCWQPYPASCRRPAMSLT